MPADLQHQGTNDVDLERQDPDNAGTDDTVADGTNRFDVARVYAIKLGLVLLHTVGNMWMSFWSVVGAPITQDTNLWVQMAIVGERWVSAAKRIEVLRRG